MATEMKHYIVVLDAASRPGDHHVPGAVAHNEYENAKRLRGDIRSKAYSLGLAHEIKEINIIPGAPVMYMECSERAMKEIKHLRGIQSVTPNHSFDTPPPNVPAAATAFNNKRPRTPGGFFRR